MGAWLGSGCRQMYGLLDPPNSCAFILRASTLLFYLQFFLHLMKGVSLGYPEIPLSTSSSMSKTQIYLPLGLGQHGARWCHAPKGQPRSSAKRQLKSSLPSRCRGRLPHRQIHQKNIAVINPKPMIRYRWKTHLPPYIYGTQ